MQIKSRNPERAPAIIGMLSTFCSLFIVESFYVSVVDYSFCSNKMV